MFIITSSEYNVSGIVIIMTWFYAQLTGLMCGCGSMPEQSWWLRSIDIISGCNSTQATSNNKYTDKDKYKWAVNMYKCLTVDLFNLHIPMALNANSFGFYMVSHKYIRSYTIFYDCVEQFHDATWVGVNSDWMSQLLYEWQKFMNYIYIIAMLIILTYSHCYHVLCDIIQCDISSNVMITYHLSSKMKLKLKGKINENKIVGL